MFDYANPPDRIKEAATRIYHEQMAERVAASGEPFRCYFDSGELHARARRLGYTEIEYLIERSWFSAIFRICLSLPGRGRAGTSSGWRRGKEDRNMEGRFEPIRHSCCVFNASDRRSGPRDAPHQSKREGGIKRVS